MEVAVAGGDSELGDDEGETASWLWFVVYTGAHVGSVLSAMIMSRYSGGPCAIRRGLEGTLDRKGTANKHMIYTGQPHPRLHSRKERPDTFYELSCSFDAMKKNHGRLLAPRAKKETNRPQIA